jgi:C-terminal processing protease CtpA/Prc
MEQADIIAAMQQLARLVTENYVFAEVGAEVAGLLARGTEEGRYAGAADEASLAALVTEDLQSVNGDKHLRLVYNADEVPADGDESAEAAALSRWAERTSRGIARVERLDGNIGYLDLRPVLFPPSITGDAAVAAMSLVAPTDALIVDLRRCLGGDPGMVALLCSYLLGDEPVHLMDMDERASNRINQSWTLPYVPGRRFGAGKPVYLLTSATSFSGAEALSYNLQQLGRASVVGERTKGGAHLREGFRVNPHLQATIPVARAVSPVSGTNWEGTGVTPDIEVPADDAFRTAYRRALDHVLSLPDDGARTDTVHEARQARDGLPDPVSR